MSDVPDVTREEVAVRARHRVFLEGPFHGQKAASKRLNDALLCYRTLVNQDVVLVPTRPPAPSRNDPTALSESFAFVRNKRNLNVRLVLLNLIPMSGDRQHFLPRFLLKGFASRIEGNQNYTWVFRREKPPFETNLINVGVSTDFYNVSGNRELDDLITKMEDRFANSLEELRSQGTETRLEDTDIPELVTHLILRTKYLRDALQQSTEYLFNALLTALESPEMVEKMMLNYIKTHPNEFLKKVREPFKGYHFSRRQRLRMISNATPALIREAFPQFMALVELLKKYIRDNFSKLAKESHVKALMNNPIPGARVDFVRALKWHLVIKETGSFILGDVAVVFKTQHGTLKPLPDLSDTVLQTWLPISATHLVIGTADTREIDRDVEHLNTGTALLSHEFFISSRNSGREAMLAGLLGAKAGLIPEDEMEKIILNLINEMSRVSC